MPKTFTTLRRYLFLLVLLAAGTAQADAGKDLFEKQCASCHTIGGGDGGGPDLKGIGAKRSQEWLIRVIAEPDKLTAEKDPTQLELIEKYGFEMPNVGVSRADAAKIVAFLGGGSAPAKDAAAAGGAAAAAAQAPPPAPAPPPAQAGPPGHPGARPRTRPPRGEPPRRRPCRRRGRRRNRPNWRSPGNSLPPAGTSSPESSVLPRGVPPASRATPCATPGCTAAPSPPT